MGSPLGRESLKCPRVVLHSLLLQESREMWIITQKKKEWENDIVATESIGLRSSTEVQPRQTRARCDTTLRHYAAPRCGKASLASVADRPVSSRCHAPSCPGVSRHTVVTVNSFEMPLVNYCSYSTYHRQTSCGAKRHPHPRQGA